MAGIDCECEDWKENVPKINAGFFMQEIHGFSGYTGKQFNFCPWCGRKLENA